VRGCLSVLVIAAVFLVATVWFGGQPLAGAVVEASLAAAGFQADTLDVEVTASPPLRLATGHADVVRIEATGMRWNELRASSVDLTLGDVDLLNRTAATADGGFEDVDLGGADAGAGAGAEPLSARITLAGPASAALTTISIAGATVERLVQDAVERELDVRPDTVTLSAPDTLALHIAGNVVSGQLILDVSGAVVLSTTLGTIRLVAPDPSIPLQLSELAVESDALVLRGTLNVQGMLRP
jgi:hypothetical protein